VPLPTAEAIDLADKIIGPIDAQRAALIRESWTLGSVRDALLPKLVSGRIRIPDAEDPAEAIEPAAEAISAAS